MKVIEFFVESFILPHELILDFDATDGLTYGMQEKRFFHGYYDHYCFLPLYVFCGDQLLCAYLRPSKMDAAKHSRTILSLLVKRLRRK
ncbi:transposase [Victivallis sp. Marseille-Q1083]|uniref:transposase n=1 Tax=Victivallis sp. Marseille-Q1083 TaxID=2717288 RepID=UPI00158BDCAD|nr:transposase [Victivallis sp. Marseille-Q1083]